MKILRFTDLCASGQARGRRVFIRADMNVPQDDAGHITEDTRIRASVPCIRMALDAGAAVMVTSHLGRPTEGELKTEDSLAPIAERLAECWREQERDTAAEESSRYFWLRKPIGYSHRTRLRTVGEVIGPSRNASSISWASRRARRFGVMSTSISSDRFG